MRALELRGTSSHDVYAHDDFAYTATTRTVLEGQLAQRVRRRFEASATEKVWLKERYWEGGTEYTRECAAEFVIGMSGREVTFFPDERDDRGWRPSARDSVYARFGHWLDAAHHDARCWGEWCDEAAREESGSYAKIPLAAGAGLFTAAAAFARGRIGSVYWWGKRENRRWTWELHAIAECGFARPEHGDVFYPRVATWRFDTSTRTAAISQADHRRLLMAATDLLMPGRARL